MRTSNHPALAVLLLILGLFGLACLGDGKEPRDPLEAIHDAEETVKQHPDSPDAHSELAILYYDSWNREAARRHFRKALDLDRNRLEDIIYLKRLTFVPDDFTPPVLVETDRFRIRPLMASDVDLDYQAVMDSLDHLKGALGGRAWPRENMTREEDLQALQKHEKEFENRVGFGYTIMDLPETECPGCLYLYPSRLDAYDAKVVMWVSASASEEGLDPVVLETVQDWIRSDWPFENVVWPGRELPVGRVFYPTGRAGQETALLSPSSAWS